MNDADVIATFVATWSAPSLPAPAAAFVERVGWALVHFTWQGLAVAALLAVTLRLLRRRSALARYAASCAAMASLIVLPAATIVLVSVPLVSDPGAPASQASPLGGTFLAPLEPPPPAFTSWPAPTQAALTAPPAANRPGVVSMIGSFSSLHASMPVLVGGWAIGVALLAAFHAGGWVRVRRLCRVDVQPLGGLWDDTLREAAGRLGVRRAVRLLESTRAAVPMVVGWLRPVILVPASALSGLTVQEFEAILAHELAHVRRHDYLVNLFQVAVETLLFYHPAVWWISGRIRDEREHCCDDDAAAATTGGAVAYARALAKLEELRTPAPFATSRLAPAAATGSLLARVRRLLGRDDAAVAPRVRPLAALGLVVVLAAAGVGFVAMSGALAADVPKASDAASRDNVNDKGRAFKSGDVLRVTISDLEGPGVRKTYTRRIDDGATIDLPYAGRLKAAGRTPADLEDAIARAYGPEGVSIVQRADVRIEVAPDGTKPDPETPRPGALLSSAPAATTGRLPATGVDRPLAAGDVIRLTINDLEGPGVQTVFEKRVDDSGAIKLPRVGPVKAAGLTLLKLEAAITRAYGPEGVNLIPHANVSVTILSAQLGPDSTRPSAAEPAPLPADHAKRPTVPAPPDADGASGAAEGEAIRREKHAESLRKLQYLDQLAQSDQDPPELFEAWEKSPTIAELRRLAQDTALRVSQAEHALGKAHPKVRELLAEQEVVGRKLADARRELRQSVIAELRATQLAEVDATRPAGAGDGPPTADQESPILNTIPHLSPLSRESPTAATEPAAPADPQDPRSAAGTAPLAAPASAAPSSADEGLDSRLSFHLQRQQQLDRAMVETQISLTEARAKYDSAGGAAAQASVQELEARLTALQQLLDESSKRVSELQSDRRARAHDAEKAAAVLRARAGSYFIAGVPRPGQYTLGGDQPINLLQALIAAGLNPEKFRTLELVLVRQPAGGTDKETRDTIPMVDIIERKPGADRPLQGGDVLLVRERGGKAAGAAAPEPRPVASAGAEVAAARERYAKAELAVREQEFKRKEQLYRAKNASELEVAESRLAIEQAKAALQIATAERAEADARAKLPDRPGAAAAAAATVKPPALVAPPTAATAKEQPDVVAPPGVTDRELFNQLWQDVVRRGDPGARRRAVDKLREMLDDQGPAAGRVTALSVLARVQEAPFDRAPIVPLVRRSLTDDQPAVRAAALEAIAGLKTNGPDDVAAVAPLSADASETVRERVAPALMAVAGEKPPHAVELAIERLLADPSASVRRATVRSLWGRPLSPAAETTLIQMSREAGEAGQEVVYYALSTRPLVSPDVAKRLIEVMTTPGHVYASRAAWGLAHPAAPFARDMIVKALAEELDRTLDAYARQQCVNGLALHGGEAAVAKLNAVARSEDEDEKLKESARQALRRLSQ